MSTEAQKRGNAKWKKNNAKTIYFRLYKNTDADLIEFLETVDNKQALIKRLLREEMEKAR
jgi:hypothetical protein